MFVVPGYKVPAEEEQNDFVGWHNVCWRNQDITILGQNIQSLFMFCAKKG